MERFTAAAAVAQHHTIPAMISRTRRNRWLGLLAAMTVAALGVGLYLFQPWRLLTDHEVQDALPAISVPSAAAPTLAPSVSPSPSGKSGERILAAGAFVTHEHDTSGRAQLVQLADGSRKLVLLDLVASDGPDLRVWLTDRDVVAGRDGWHVFDDGRWVELARLKGNRGNQVYDIPASVALDGLRSVSIWCKRFSVSFGAAPLATP
jgi:hypothetical protein